MAGLDSVINFTKILGTASRQKYTKEEIEQMSPDEAKLAKADNKTITKARNSIGTGGALAATAIAGIVYNYNASTTRFGNRGQDTSDKLALQDRLVNKSLGAAASLIGGAALGPAGLAIALAGIATTVINEGMQHGIAMKNYNYKLQLDQEQNSLIKERAGIATYNNSRN